MFKKSLLDELNGLNWYGRYLAEDFFLTHALHEKYVHGLYMLGFECDRMFMPP